MLVYFEIVHIFFYKNLILSFKARRGLQNKMDAGKTQRSVSLCGV